MRECVCVCVSVRECACVCVLRGVGIRQRAHNLQRVHFALQELLCALAGAATPVHARLNHARCGLGVVPREAIHRALVHLLLRGKQGPGCLFV